MRRWPSRRDRVPGRVGGRSRGFCTRDPSSQQRGCPESISPTRARPPPRGRGRHRQVMGAPRSKPSAVRAQLLDTCRGLSSATARGVRPGRAPWRPQGPRSFLSCLLTFASVPPPHWHFLPLCPAAVSWGRGYGCPLAPPQLSKGGNICHPPVQQPLSPGVHQAGPSRTWSWS